MNPEDEDQNQNENGNEETGNEVGQMAKFRAPGPGVMTLEHGEEGMLPVNDETDALVKQGLLERVG